MVVVEDETLLRDLLSSTLTQRFQPRDLQAFSDGRPALQHCLTHTVDLLLIDLRLPDLDGREIIRLLRVRHPKLRVIVLTAQVDAALPAELVALGVAGFIDKSAPLEHVVRAIERVLAGGMYFFAGVMPSASCAAVRGSPGAGPHPSILTAREREIARLVTSGRSSKEIARELGLSTRTVENHRASLMQKLAVRDTARLVRWCLEHGLG